MIESIDSILENVTNAEAVTNNKRKSFVKIEEEILQLQSNIETLKKKTCTMTTQYQEMQKKMTDKEFELSSLEQRCSILEKLLSQKNEILEKENNKLEELQKNVWNERECFCRKVRAFTSKYSVSTNFHKLKFDCASSVNISHSGSSPNACVINELKEEKARVETELNNLNQREILNRLSELVEEKENLLKEPTMGKQFIELQQKLQTALKRTNQFHVKRKIESLLENQQKKSQIMKKFRVVKRKRTLPDQTVLDEWLENGTIMQRKESIAAPSLVRVMEHEVKLNEPVATSRNSPKKMSSLKFVPKVPSTLFLNMRNETSKNK